MLLVEEVLVEHLLGVAGGHVVDRLILRTVEHVCAVEVQPHVPAVDGDDELRRCRQLFHRLVEVHGGPERPLNGSDACIVKEDHQDLCLVAEHRDVNQAAHHFPSEVLTAPHL